MRRLISTLLMATCMCEAAVAQPVQSERIAYDAAFFEQFSPRTALDMVERVPGFAIEEGEERRGFAGAQGNVLIDGEPPVSKSQEIEDVLARIPARDVIRIELIRGAGSSAGSSQAVRVNIVRRAGSGEGVWEVELARTRDGRVTPSGEAAWSGRRGDFEYGISGAVNLERLPIRGERTDYDAGGAVDERRTERIPTDEREGRLAGEASFPLGGGIVAINGQLSRVELDERELAALFSSGGASSGSIDTDLAERENIGEVGVSYRRDLGDWRGELAAIVTRRRFAGDEVTTERDDTGAFEEGAQQTQRIDSGESILRLQARRDLWEGWRIELGAEAALNTLEQRLTLIEDDGSGPVPVILPSANVTVEEQRGEASVMLAGALARGWVFEGGVAVETSSLTQSGDASRDTELTYWKPAIQLTRALGERNQLRARIYRDVSQLDFEDFVSAADITSSIVNAGNPDLRPETSWRLELSGDWRFAEDGAFSVTLYRWWVEDALDIIPVGLPGNQLDAPGNIGDADVTGLRASLSLPLPFNSEFRLEGFTQESEATDPLTGERRSISAFDESLLTVGFRQDLAEIAWGIDFEREREAPEWRLDRVEHEQDADELTLWVETTAFANIKLRAWASNLNQGEETRERRIFDPTRLGAFDSSDSRAREEGVTIGVSASGGF
ncbi:MAG: TonB-dependent receptor plug domain-containing protein [Hyphomonadaceae bacterium]